jgi:hypothetical protein
VYSKNYREAFEHAKQLKSVLPAALREGCANLEISFRSVESDNNPIDDQIYMVIETHSFDGIEGARFIWNKSGGQWRVEQCAEFGDESGAVIYSFESRLLNCAMFAWALTCELMPECCRLCVDMGLPSETLLLRLPESVFSKPDRNAPVLNAINGLLVENYMESIDLQTREPWMPIEFSLGTAHLQSIGDRHA